MGLKLIEAPSTPLISTSDAKAYLRVDHSTEDSVIAMMVKASIDLAQEYTKQSFLEQVWEKSFNGPPTVKTGNHWWDGVRELPVNFDQKQVNYLELDRGPLIQVNEFRYYSLDNSEGTYDYNANMYIDDTRKKPRLVLNYGAIFPVGLRAQNSMVVQYTSGFGSSPSDVPAAIKQAVYLILANMYEKRGDDAGEIPSLAKSLLDPYRAIEV